MILAIESGGDWNDASVTYLTLKDGYVVEALYLEYKEWWAKAKKEKRESGEWPYGPKEYTTFANWLVEKGYAREETEGLEVFRED